MPTHAYAYPRRRRVVPKARNNLVNDIKHDAFFMVSLEWPNLANLKSENILAYYPNRLEILCKLTKLSQKRTAVFYSRPQPRTKKEGKPHTKKECKSASATATCHNKKHNTIM
jgi:hypothetical protein